ncbi:MAG: GGDEF domain-containing protein [Lachnospiraceae bacterium]|nr:GGDEF domain-containing protein [Lachnospiraceae bacterium]
MESVIYKDFNSFLRENRIKVNRYLNTVLWFFAITGPAIAAGIKLGIFEGITYITCILITGIVVVLAAIHMVLQKKFPKSMVTCIFALTSLDMLLMFMSYNHVKINLTWFLVPLLSILFCDKALFLYAIIMNSIGMVVSTWLCSGYYANLVNSYEKATEYFADIISGFLIETVIMSASGYILVRLTVDYFKTQFEQYNTIISNEKSLKEKVELLDSMAEIYDNVNLIDFVNNTEMSLRDTEHTKHGIDMSSQTHTIMNQRIRNQVMPDQLDRFLNFTNIKTVRSRLSHKKIISADFIDVVSGWFRAQYITVDSTLDGIPNTVIYTIRNVDEEKRREENLIRISMTDEMTRLFNRRCFDEDLKDFRNNPLPGDFVLFSVDVNGLKKVNDTKGHAAGDELIKGAADCLALSVGNCGKAYRTGGDEFMAVVFTEDPEAVRKKITDKAGEWHGVYTDEITMSVGYAASKDNKDKTVDELERIADADMYAEKEKFYRERGIDRRR